MKGLIAAVMTVFLFTPAYSIAQMSDKMDKHMDEHMGKGTANSAQKTEDKDAKRDHTGGAWHIKESEEAGVKVKVTYKNPGKDKGPVFEVVLDTHSVDLDQYKFDEITVLRDDAGKKYNSSLISSSGSGHHREAALEFKGADVSSVRYIELVVKGVAGVDARVFRFEPVKRPAK